MSATPNIDAVLSTRRHADGLRCCSVDVVGVADVGPRLRTVTFGGPQLGWLTPPCANTAVRLFFPRPGEVVEEVAPVEDPPPSAVALRTRARVYTVRRHDPVAATIDVDFVLHGDGLASGWAASAQVGDRLLLSGPRAHAVPDRDATHLLFVADETALPALEAILEALPASAAGVAFVVVDDERDVRELGGPAGVAIRWVLRAEGRRVHDEVAAWCDPSPPRGTRPAAWLAGELFETRAVRDLLLRAGHDPASIQSFPYWRRGSTATALDEARSALVVEAIAAGREPGHVDDLELVDRPAT